MILKKPNDTWRGGEPLWDLTVNSDAPENALYRIAALHLNTYIDVYNDLQNGMKKKDSVELKLMRLYQGKVGE